MVMVQVDKTQIKRKIRRLLGKAHIGLSHTQPINVLLDHLDKLVRHQVYPFAISLFCFMVFPPCFRISTIYESSLLQLVFHTSCLCCSLYALQLLVLQLVCGKACVTYKFSLHQLVFAPTCLCHDWSKLQLLFTTTCVRYKFLFLQLVFALSCLLDIVCYLQLVFATTCLCNNLSVLQLLYASTYVHYKFLFL